MFNALLSTPKLFALALFSFTVIFIIRQLFFKKKIQIFLYHLILFCILFITTVGGGGVQNADYSRLEKFILLEKNNELDIAKKNPQNYDKSLRIDLQQFKNSDEFINYIQQHDNHVDKVEAMAIGWIFTLMTEIAMIGVFLIEYIRKTITLLV